MREHLPIHRRPVQITSAAIANERMNAVYLYALCSDGTMWVRCTSHSGAVTPGWRQVDAIPPYVAEKTHSGKGPG